MLRRGGSKDTEGSGPQGRIVQSLALCLRSFTPAPGFPSPALGGQWSSLLSQRPARFRSSDPTDVCTGACCTTASRLFASAHAHTRLCARPAQGQRPSWCPRAGAIRPVEGYVVLSHPVVCGASDRDCQHPCSAGWKEYCPPLARAGGGRVLPMTSTHLCPTPLPLGA